MCTAFTKDRRDIFDAKGCPGFSAKFREVIGGDSSHNIVVASVAGSSLVFCASCGAWLTSSGKRGKEQGILAICPGKASLWGRKVLDRVAKGLHPDPAKVEGIEATWQIADAKEAAKQQGNDGG